MKISSVIVLVLATLAPAHGFTSYADKMSGTKVSVKAGGFAPGGGKKPQAPTKGVPGNYLDNFASAAPAAAAAPPAPAAPVAAAAPPAAPAAYSSPAAAGASAPTSAAYLSVLGGAAGAPSGTGPKGYLDVVSTANTAINGPGMPGYLSVLRTEVTPGGAGLGGYLASMGGGSAVKASSFTPTKSSVAKGGYAPAAVTSSSSSGNEVLNAIGKLNSNMRQNQQSTIDVLKSISQGVKGSRG